MEFYYHVYCDVEFDTVINHMLVNEFIELCILDFEIICKNLDNEETFIKTYNGVFKMKDVKEDYLINGLVLVLKTAFDNGLYKREKDWIIFQ